MQQIFDRHILKIHRDHAAKDLHDHDFLLEFSANDIIERLELISIPNGSMLELGARTGILTKQLLKKYSNHDLTATDISPNMLALNPATHKRVLDEEFISSSLYADCSFAVIISLLNMHWINDLPKWLLSLKQIVSKDGIFIASLFGGTSLKALRTTLLQAEIDANSGHFPHISPFATAEDIYRLLWNAGFTFVVVDSKKVELEYDSPLALMRELKASGESSNLLSSNRCLSKKIIKNLETISPFIDHVEIITFAASQSNLQLDL